jgi:hypothetical protein
MRFPSWYEFTEKLGIFEKNLAEKIKEFKDGHPILDSTIKGLITILPPPINAISDKIYNNFDGSLEEKSRVVLSYLKHLEALGEKHYDQISTKVDKILNEISDVKKIIAKESTLQIIQEILISTGTETSEKLDRLRDDLRQIEGKIDQIYEIGVDSNQRIKKIETRISPRHLTTPLISELEKYLPKNKNVKILISSMQGDADGYQFSEQIIKHLISKGWKVEPDIAIRSPPVYGLEITNDDADGFHIWVGFSR